MTNTKWAISLVTFALLAGCATPPDPCPDAPKILIDNQLICGYDRKGDEHADTDAQPR